MWFIICVSVFVIILAILYHRGKKAQAKMADIPGPKGYPIIGCLIDVMINWDRLQDWIYDSVLKYGHTAGFWRIGGPPGYICVVDPECVEHVLKTNFKNYNKGPTFHSVVQPLLGDGIFAVDGEQWKSQRKVASHQFSITNLKEMMAVFCKHGNIVLKNIEQISAENHGQVDLADQFFRYTLDSIGMIAFGTEIGSLHKNRVAFADAFDRAQVIVDEVFKSPWKRFSSFLRGDAADIKILDDYVYDLIKRRRAAQDDDDQFDLLSRYIQLEDENGNKYSDKYLRDIVLNFIIAGRDTTAQCLTWACYMLAQNPIAQDKLYKEISDNIHEDEDPTYETVKDTAMPYLKAVINETLRLYPSVPIDTKEAVEDDVLPSGHRVPKGAWVIYSPWVSGRHPDFWENPLEFQPERWMGNAIGKSANSIAPDQHRPWVFFPFQGGPRICLGMNMAYLEAKTMLCLLLRKYSFSLVPGQNITYKRSLTLPPKNGLKVNLHLRQ